MWKHPCDCGFESSSSSFLFFIIKCTCYFKVANKIDVNYKVTKKNFKFAAKHNLPFFFVSAADGTNVVKIFESAIEEAYTYKEHSSDFTAEVLNLLNEGN